MSSAPLRPERQIFKSHKACARSQFRDICSWWKPRRLREIETSLGFPREWCLQNGRCRTPALGCSKAVPSESRVTGQCAPQQGCGLGDVLMELLSPSPGSHPRDTAWEFVEGSKGEWLGTEKTPLMCALPHDRSVDA